MKALEVQLRMDNHEPFAMLAAEPENPVKQHAYWMCRKCGLTWGAFPNYPARRCTESLITSP